MEQVDTLVHARWIIPVVPADAVYEHHCVAIKDGCIVAVLPSDAARRNYQASNILELQDHALIPGLVNAHTHAAMSLFRGLADDLALMDWLNNHIWPAEKTWISAEFVHTGTQLAMAEMLRGGITCFNDMYFFPDETARAASAAGMRAVVGLIMIDFPTVWAATADDYLSKGLEVYDYYRGDPLIEFAFAPHAPYTVSDAPLERIQTLAEEMDLPIHMHVHETADEVQQSVEHHKERPLQRLNRLGLLSERLVAVHMTQLEGQEIEQLARAGSHVVHCPESNLKLASGFCPVANLHRAGINIAFGTDGAASNNDLDMFSEMRTAAQLAKAVASDATAVPAASALHMATLGGAVALGLQQTTGSLEVGKSADIVAIDFGAVELQPVYHPISHLVYACHRSQVSDVWIAGRHVLKERVLTSLDSEAIRAHAREWGKRISSS